MAASLVVGVGPDKNHEVLKSHALMDGSIRSEALDGKHSAVINGEH